MNEELSILHLPERFDRMELLGKELFKQGITNFHVQDGYIDIYNRKKSITIGHKRMVQRAKDLGYQRAILCEDDIRFLGKDKGAWKYFLDNIPEDFDMYVGLVYVGNVKDNRITETSSGITTLYIIHERFYDIFLSIPDDCHIDRELSSLWDKYKLMVCPKFVVEQTGGFSDNTLKKCSYETLLEGKKLFKN